MLRYAKEYKYYLHGELHLSNNTCESYLNDIDKYLNFLVKYRKVEDVNDIQTEDIRHYLASLKRRGISASTRSRNLTSIRSFHKFLALEKYTKRNVAEIIDKPKVEKKLPSILSIEEIETLINSIDINTPIDIRNKAMIETAYSAGLRVSELIDLKLSDLHLDMGFIKVFGKGNKERIVPIGEYAINGLNIYIQKARPQLMKRNTPYLFLNQRGEKMSRQSFFLMLKEKTRLAGIKKNVYPHMLRHSFASHLLQNGLDLRMIQELLGHEDISTTEIYTHVNNQKIKEIYLKAHPHAQRKD
ncbi:MAG TPA: site-specific tyrosine recombinase XerD [Acholeplasmataceae bacterium]|nr:site-specific tyrosine recombinase XerD [Acholeplasmataceae bacterium]